MKKIKYLKIQFDTPLLPFEISAFRGAIVSLAGRENILFHNHINDEEFLYGYPVIQYKSIGGKAVIICLDYGTDEIHKLFQSQTHKIKIGESERTLNIENLVIKQFNLNVWESTFKYRIRNWASLSSKNFELYNKIGNDIEKTEFLEKILVGNIISMAKGLKWNIEKKILVRFDNWKESTHPVTHKDVGLKVFNVEFRSNVFLPPLIGLGKGTSFGFGTVSSIKEQKNENL